MKRSAFLVLILLAGDGMASAALRKTINGSGLAGGWAALAGTTVTTNNSGESAATRFNLVGGTNTYRAFTANDPAPAGVNSNGYLETTESGTCYFQMESGAGSSFLASDGTDYFLTAWIRAERTENSLPGSDTSGNLVVASTGGNIFSANVFLTNSTNAPTAGWGLYSVTVGSIGGSFSSLYDANGVKPPLIKFGEWAKLTIHLHRNAAGSGAARVYVNGVLIVTLTGADTSNSVITWASQNLYMLAPNIAGLRWNFTEFSADDSVPTIRPVYGLNESDSKISKVFMPWGAHASSVAGNFFTTTGGTSSVGTEYSNAIGRPMRRFLSVSAATCTATSIDDIGALPFNAQGWATIAVTDFYCPASGLLGIQLKNAANAANVLAFQFSASGGSLSCYVTDSAGTQYYILSGAPLSTARQLFMVHLNQDGRARWTLIDLTSAANSTARVALSGPLQNWTPASLGKIAFVATPNGGNIEIGSTVIGARPSLIMLDSLTTTSYAGAGTAINTPSKFGQSLPFAEERQCVPGAMQNQRELGLERMLIVGAIGRSGLTRRDWSLNVLSGLNYTSGVEYIVPDGGIANDLSSSLVGPNTDVTAAVDIAAANLDKFLDIALENDCAVWLTTCLQRNLQTAISAITDNGAGKCRLTATGHSLSASDNPRIGGSTGIAGLDSSTGLTISVINANTIDATSVNYSSPTLASPYLIGLSLGRETFRQEFNDELRRMLAGRNARGLLQISDLDADMTANPAFYPTTTTDFWQDLIHPKDPTSGGSQLRGSWVCAQRMVQTRQIVPTTIPPRRWPLTLTPGRN